MSYIFEISLSQLVNFLMFLYLNSKPSVVFKNTPIETHLSLHLTQGVLLEK